MKSPELSPFAALGVPEVLCRGVADMGFTYPMEVQQEVIPLLYSDSCDLIALAQTGTGKTAAFGLPLLSALNLAEKSVQALVLCPTRELCMQISDDLHAYAAHLRGVKIAALYGGTPLDVQRTMLRKGVHLVVATPGRLLDLLGRGWVKLGNVRTLVLDEADEMLNMGFQEAIDGILPFLPEPHRTLLFSATMSREVEHIAQTYLQNPREVVVGRRGEAATNVQHHYYLVQAKDRYNALKRIVDYYPRIYGIVFCRTKAETQTVADHLVRDGYNAEALHGDLTQPQRDLTMQKFRSRVLRLLVATDVAARGIDVDDLTHVVHYGLPSDSERYVHRSGRTGRIGKQGLSIAIVHSGELRRIHDIEKSIGKAFVKQSIPTAQDICTKQLYRVIDQIEKTEVDEAAIAPFMQHLRYRFEYVDKYTLLEKVVSREFGRFLDYYSQAPEIEEVAVKPPSFPRGGSSNRKSLPSGRFGGGSVQRGYCAIVFNAGKQEGFYPGVVMQFINRHIAGRQEVGHIELEDHRAIVEVPKRDASRVVKALNGRWFKNKEIEVKTK